MRIAVVIPVYNEARYIKQCLDALVDQSRVPDEVIIVDNNCTDATIAIAKKYVFVKVINEIQQGICAATKKGLDEAAQSSDIIMRCDADSIPPKKWVEDAERYLFESGAVAVTGPGIFTGLHGVRRWLASLLYMKMYFWSVGLALGHKPLFGSNFAITATAWKSIATSTHLVRQDLHDDIDISYHLSPIGSLVYKEDFQMPISHRPFMSLHKLMQRYPIGLRSIIIHWPTQAPWRSRK